MFFHEIPENLGKNQKTSQQGQQAKVSNQICVIRMKSKSTNWEYCIHYNELSKKRPRVIRYPARSVCVYVDMNIPTHAHSPI